MLDAAWVRAHVLPAAESVLPAATVSPEARAFVLAIGWQESRFKHRRQTRGPALGFWQFEAGGGVAGVMSHRKSNPIIAGALAGLMYPKTISPVAIHWALEHNDVLAACFARALLWTLPDALPTRVEPGRGWAQYLAAWRPGKPKPETWDEAWEVGWSA
jgi:hypothetical protein